MKLLLFIILTIIFVPLPIKITLFFSKDNYYINVYKFSLIQKKKKGETDSTNISNNQKNTKSKKKKSSLFQNLSVDGIILYIKEFKSNKFKPRLKIDGYFNYSFADAAKTAISYGLLSTSLPLLSFIFSIIFKIKKFILPINPIFKDEIITEIKITSIITLSLAQIIYMVILFIKVTLYIKEKEIEGGKI
ncbi:DUF2953 domain-containing protein [Clostridium sp. SHJSY1]|uniref:DUF2953 domain-containing protein n=1 Tax=Clostridium sp. SHJSY1 TaxID=2942483 RepID=UPI0028765BD9|nr:DUF2953 domain-containing protein [Clostridium sp. SHJSY1]MDS0527854.1 DUF2953 domain-containing protein [Clostridium sp. SHJSY1]